MDYTKSVKFIQVFQHNEWFRLIPKSTQSWIDALPCIHTQRQAFPKSNTRGNRNGTIVIIDNDIPVWELLATGQKARPNNGKIRDKTDTSVHHEENDHK